MRALVYLSLLLTSPALALSPAPPWALESGHSAVWYDSQEPAAGGWILEILEDERGVAYRYGYDRDGNPVWQGGAGEFVRDELLGPDVLRIDGLFAGSGARFGDAFDVGDVVLERVAESAEFRFSSCEEGVVTRTFDDGSSVSEILERLTRTMGAGCVSRNGVPGFPIGAFAGQSGTWVDPERVGEGFVLQWLDRGEAVLFWFTYDLQGDPLWLFGVGAPIDGGVVFPALYSARRTPAGEAELTLWGSAEFDLDCQSAFMTWDSVIEGFGAGRHDLVRLTALAGLDCPTAPPMFSDLYALSIRQLPMPAGRTIQVRDIADNGAVLGLEHTPRGLPSDGELRLLRSGDSEWLALTAGPLAIGDRPLFLAPDASLAYANLSPAEASEVIEPFRWRPGVRWELLPGLGAPFHVLLGASSDRSVLTGFTEDEGDPDRNLGWSWSAGTGRTTLPGLEDSGGGTRATCASNDGIVVGGFERRPQLGAPVPELGAQTGTVALLWRNGSPGILRDDEGLELSRPVACSEDGTIVYGAGTNGVDFESSRIGQPWFWTVDGRFGVLEGLEYDPVFKEWLSHDIDAISADGTIVLGTSSVRGPVDPPPPPAAFLWTQATGLVWVEEELEAAGLLDPGRECSGSRGRAMSVNGRRLLVSLCDESWGAFVVTLESAPEE